VLARVYNLAFWVCPSDIWRVISLMYFLTSEIAEVFHPGTGQTTPGCLSFSVPLRQAEANSSGEGG
jgi:hypothetical protein